MTPPTYIQFPRAFDTRLDRLPKLIEDLTWSHLEGLPFGPCDYLQAPLGGLNWHRIGGCARAEGDIADAVPLQWVIAACRRGASLGFNVRSDGREVAVAVGSDPPSAATSARALQSMLAAQLTPAAWRHDRSWHSGCVSGVPRAAGHSCSPRGAARPDAGWLDPLLDSLPGEPLSLTVFATPYPAAELQTRRRVLADAARDIDRQHLKVDQLASADRTALRALSLLDLHLGRADDGLVEGAWSVAVVASAPDAAVVRHVLSLVAGSLIDTREQTSMPLRVHPCEPNGQFAPHSNVLRSAELASFLALPRRDRRGFRRTPNVRFDVDHASPPSGVVLGAVLDGDVDAGLPFRVAPEVLCRHALVAGHTGSGKSTTVRHLLRGALDTGVPFLVIDPVKPAAREYADILAASDRVLAFRVGAIPEGGEAVFHFNPMAFPTGFPLFTHIDRLKATFTAAFGLSPPGPYLLERAILQTYQRFGWDVGTGLHRSGHGAADPLAFPRLSDLLAEIERVVDAARYGAEVARTLKAALETRVGNLCLGAKGLSLDTHEQLPDAVLYDSPVVLELMGFGSHEEQALVMGLVMARLFAFRQARGLPAGGSLRHLLVIEEAHRLLKATPQRSAEEGNTAHQAVEAFGALIAEIRAYGQGIVVAEQLPSCLAAAVVKQTGLKFIHRLTPREDRELVGDAMALDDDQKGALCTLATGEAVVFMEGMDGALRVRVPPPATAPRAQATTTMLDRLRRILPADAERLAHATERAGFTGLLHDLPVRRAADLVLSVAGWGERVDDALRDLREAAAGTNGIDGTNEARAMTFALQDALLRRAVFHGWSYAEWERRCRELRTDQSRFLRGFRTLVGWRSGPHPWCAACPAPCRHRYDGEACAADRDFAPEFEAARRTRPEAVGRELAAAARRSVARRVGPREHHAPALAYCAIGHASMRRGDTLFETDRLLTEYLTRGTT